MTKQELAIEIAQKTGVSREVVTNVLEQAATSIVESVKEGDAVFMRGFGVFKTKEQAPKKGRDIGRGKTVNIPARKKPVFKAYRDFVSKVQD